jgi:mannose-1-phosphate guanylyltransferase/mannose-6-phosphate isomerase
MLQQTALRFVSEDFLPPWLLVSSTSESQALEQLAQIKLDAGGIVVEPHVRSTGPAIAAIARILSDIDPNMVILALPSDHFVEYPETMQAAIVAGLPAAREGKIVTLGIVPSHAETGFGYIEVDEKPEHGLPARVLRFVEKPDSETALAYLSGGRHLWNAGMFLFTPKAMLCELEKHAPDLLAATSTSVLRAKQTGRGMALDFDAYSRCPRVSIDHAVMEKSDAIVVVPVNPGWNDVGSWDAVSAIYPRDEAGNAFVGDVFSDNVENTFILSTGQRVIAANGVRDLIVVDTHDALYITRAGESQGISHIIDKLSSNFRNELETHPVVERPWGSYRSLAVGQGFQVKHIFVKPGGHLSLQYHHHRAEHWTVVSGTAEITVADQVKLVHPNESIFIPMFSLHRLHNPGKLGLHLIEVQCGEYLGEDDIVRVDDVYGRIAAE